jgi:nicotinamidase/pyrazinamidase
MNLKKSALVLINFQIDYFLGGAREVQNSNSILPIANKLIEKFDHIYAAIDWHPANHISFAGNHPWRHIGQTISIDGLEQELLPFHCVQETFGAHFPKALNVKGVKHVIQKGILADTDDYSCFFDAGRRRATTLLEALKKENIQMLFFAGLGTEAAVKNSVLDALDLGFKSVLIEDVCKAWDADGAGNQAMKEMVKAGALKVNSGKILF